MATNRKSAKNQKKSSANATTPAHAEGSQRGSRGPRKRVRRADRQEAIKAADDLFAKLHAWLEASTALNAYCEWHVPPRVKLADEVAALRSMTALAARYTELRSQLWHSEFTRGSDASYLDILCSGNKPSIIATELERVVADTAVAVALRYCEDRADVAQSEMSRRGAGVDGAVFYGILSQLVEYILPELERLFPHRKFTKAHEARLVRYLAGQRANWRYAKRVPSIRSFASDLLAELGVDSKSKLQAIQSKMWAVAPPT